MAKPSSLLADLVKAHTLQFERPLARLPNAAAVIRFATAFAISAAMLWLGREILAQARATDLLLARFWLAMGLLALTLVQARLVIGPYSRALGLRAPAAWTRREVLYAASVVSIACCIFGLLYKNVFADMLSARGLGQFLLLNLCFGLAWGAYQEICYRGFAQTALGTILGPVGGLVAANLLFTFGPLHSSIWAAVAHYPSAAAMFIPVFAIGLIFGLIYWRTGNLWLPAVFHGLWPLNMVG